MNRNAKEPMENQKQKGYMKKSTVVIIILLLLLLFAGAVIAFLYFQDKGGVVLDPLSGKYHSDVELPEETDPYYIRIPGLTTIYLAEGSDTAKAVLWNPDSNPCYFVYSIELKDTEEIIYESGMIAPGNAVQEVHFNKTFDVGSYPIIIRVESYDLLEPENTMNGGEVEAKLVVVREAEN